MPDHPQGRRKLELRSQVASVVPCNSRVLMNNSLLITISKYLIRYNFFISENYHICPAASISVGF